MKLSPLSKLSLKYKELFELIFLINTFRKRWLPAHHRYRLVFLFISFSLIIINFLLALLIFWYFLFFVYYSTSFIFEILKLFTLSETLLVGKLCTTRVHTRHVRHLIRFAFIILSTNNILEGHFFYRLTDFQMPSAFSANFISMWTVCNLPKTSYWVLTYVSPI